MSAFLMSAHCPVKAARQFFNGPVAWLGQAGDRSSEHALSLLSSFEASLEVIIVAIAMDPATIAAMP